MALNDPNAPTSRWRSTAILVALREANIQAAASHPVRVEIQFRTIAMDFWASLEHKTYYKYDKTVPAALLTELAAAAEHAHGLDLKMEAIHRQIRGGAAADQ